jgi:heat shock protein HtpX
MNTFKSIILMILMTGLLVLIGDLVGGTQGMIMALVFAGVMNFGAYWFSDKIVLMQYGAKEIPENSMPELYRTVRNLTSSAGLPMPRLYLLPMNMPNAFATGRNPRHAAVAVTTGIVDLLSEDELAGVIAHELSHVRNRDILVGTIAATLAGAIFMLARMGMFFGGGRDDDNRNGIALILLAILAPIAAMFIQMAISRSREYEADATGARMLGKPLALAAALRKLTAGVRHNPADVNPTTAHMFVVSPFSGKSLMTLFSTHPPLEERIKRLEKMAAQMEEKSYNVPRIVY